MTAAAAALPGAYARRYRVMVVDDSAVIRGAITRALETDPEVSVVASVGNGKVALATLPRGDIDVIVLDIEMPELDGLAALPKLLQIAPDTRIIMASTLTTRNAAVSLQALSAGASDYVAKPTSISGVTGGKEFQRELLEKVKALAQTRRRRRGEGLPAREGVAVPVAPPRAAAKIALRAPSKVTPRIIAIGSSTGGPQALHTMLAALAPASVRQPIVITQHMPPTFTAILAENITRISGRPAAEGKDGEPLQAGRIYVAPGDHHMKVEARGAGAAIRLLKDPPENFCRPAVDPMFRSVAEVFGPASLAIVLTGMGADGAKGGAVIAAAGGTLVAQDEASSVVWGMPGATAATGVCSAVLPLTEIAPYVTKLAGGAGR